jgi:hypothetical protein
MSASALLTKSRQVLSKKIVHPAKTHNRRIEEKFLADDSVFPKEAPEMGEPLRASD